MIVGVKAETSLFTQFAIGCIGDTTVTITEDGNLPATTDSIIWNPSLDVPTGQCEFALERLDAATDE
jgi:hypothetical protein